MAAALAGAFVAMLWPPLPLEVPEPGVVLADVTVVNPGLEARAHQTVRIGGSTIDSVSGYSSATDGSGSGSRYAGAYVLPGLIDMHVHHPIGRLATDIELFDLLHLSHGVTTVRDCASIDGSVLGTRARIAAGELAGPRIFACGPLIDGEPPSWPGAEIARSGTEAERIADEAAALGVDCIKAYSNLSADALGGLRKAANRHRLPLVGHVPSEVAFEDARLDDVQHLTGVPHVRDRPAGLIAGLLSGWDTIDDRRIDFVARTSIEQGVAHTPTLVVLHQILRLHDYPTLLRDPPARMLPRYYREMIWRPDGMAGWSVPVLDDATRSRIRQNLCKAVRRLHAVGVILHVGSDTFNPFVVPGVAMHEELRNFVECGFTPEEAWEAATSGNGAALSKAGLGVLRAGAPADLLVFREDPTVDLVALSTLEAVVADGRLYPHPFLERVIARYQEHHSGWLFDRLTMLVFQLFTTDSDDE